MVHEKERIVGNSAVFINCFLYISKLVKGIFFP